MEATTSGRLVAILANPPLTDGTRTLRRVELAAELLGFTEVGTANLFALPSHATGAIAKLGETETGWLQARPHLTTSIKSADGVLLAYGTTTPTGDARLHFRQQVVWLTKEIADRSLPTWHVGDGPRHPSRWHRWTHRTYPEIPFLEALKISIIHSPPSTVGAYD